MWAAGSLSLSPKETSKLDMGPVDLPKLPVGRLTGSTHSPTLGTYLSYLGSRYVLGKFLHV